MSALMELGVSFDTQFVDVETVDLGFLIHTDAHGGFQDDPEDHGDDEHEGTDGRKADNLSDVGGVRVRPGNDESAPEAGDQVLSLIHI